MLKDLIDKMARRFHVHGAEEGKPAELTPEQFKQLVLDVARTQEVELGCESTFAILDEYADLVVSGQNADEALPLVRHHVEMCPECRDEYETLLEIVKSLGT